MEFGRRACPGNAEEATAGPGEHHLNDYLLQLATSFQSYYNEHRVIGDDADLTLARLCFIKAVQIVLRNGLSLLGVSAPETM